MASDMVFWNFGAMPFLSFLVKPCKTCDAKVVLLVAIVDMATCSFSQSEAHGRHRRCLGRSAAYLALNTQLMAFVACGFQKGSPEDPAELQTHKTHVWEERVVLSVMVF